MAYVLAHHIISPLGRTSGENYKAVEAGETGIQTYPSGILQMPDAFTASLHLENVTETDSEHLLETDFERMAFYSASHAMQSAGIDNGEEQEEKQRIVFILSSTKGDVEGMTPLVDSAQRIASRLGILSLPVVVCNACISGLSALILADRLLTQNKYDIAVVCGCDVPRRFIISGFHSLKALSSAPCRPFDMERFGLNLGEAAATIVLGRQPMQHVDMAKKPVWQIGKGYVKNDAFHISAPSKTSEGLYSALMETLKDTPSNDLAFVNAHGTATLFNDQMESVAIQRAGLSEIPVNALKGYFGHTLGAAGILETILGMMSVDRHCVLGTKGFEELGVSGKVNISAQHRATDKHAFVKMLSGFGGCNATMLASSMVADSEGMLVSPLSASSAHPIHYTKSHLVHIAPDEAMVDGKTLGVQQQASLLTGLYKQYIGNYPKYYKMDGLSRLGFVASELLLQALGEEMTRKENMAIVLFNHSSSVDADRKYMETIIDCENYFPSPSIFVYTLPNIVTGEIAIRNQIHGETSFYILPSKNEQQMNEILEASFVDEQTEAILTGWINYDDEQHYEAELCIVRKEV